MLHKCCKMKVSQLKVGAVVTYLTIAFSIISGILYTPWMIQKIGESDYGLYTLANSIISFFMVDFGLSSATSRFVAKYRAENKEMQLQQFLYTIYKFYLLIDILIFIVLAVLYFNIEILYVNLTAEELYKFKVVYCIVGVYSLINFPCITFNGILLAYEKIIPLKSADLLQKIIAIFLTVVCLIKGHKLYALVLVNAISVIIANIIKLRYVKNCVKITQRKNVDKEQKRVLYREIFCFSTWSTIWALSQRMIFNVIPSIIGMVLANASTVIAVFGVITTIEGYFFTITTAINGIFLSRITKLMLNDQDGKKLTLLAIKVGRFQFLLSCLIVVGFALLGKEFILLWMGESFADAYYGVLLIIIPGIFYNSLQVTRTAMLAQNLIKYQACIQLFVGICNILLAFLLIRTKGIIGASTAIFISYSLRLILTLLLIRRKLKIDLWKFIKECYIKLSIPALVSIMLGGVALNKLVASSWYMLCVKGILIVIIYVIVLVLLNLLFYLKKVK